MTPTAPIALWVVVAAFVLCPFHQRIILNRYALHGLIALAIQLVLTGGRPEPLAAVVSLWGGGWWVRLMLARSVSLRLLRALAAGTPLRDREDIEGRVADLIRYRLALETHGRYAVTRRGRRIARATAWAAA